MKKEEDLDYEVLNANSSESFDRLDQTVSSSELISADSNLLSQHQNYCSISSYTIQNPVVREFGPEEQPIKLELNTIESIYDEEEEK